MSFLPDPYCVTFGMEVTAFRYLAPLVLTRPLDAVKLRTGEDATYVVGADYPVEVLMADPTISYGVPCRRSYWHRITVPAGMPTDLASVPAFSRCVVDRVGPHLEACVVHDFLYGAWQLVMAGSPTPQARLFSDRVLLAGMREAKVDTVKRQMIYRAVRAFGRAAFESKVPARLVKVS